MSKAKAHRAHRTLVAELEEHLDREVTLAERRAAWLVASAPTKAAKRITALVALVASQEDDPDLEPSPQVLEELSALSEAFSGAVRCVRCGLELTDPEGVRLGIGPTCRKARA